MREREDLPDLCFIPKPYILRSIYVYVYEFRIYFLKKRERIISSLIDGWMDQWLSFIAALNNNLLSRQVSLLSLIDLTWKKSHSDDVSTSSISRRSFIHTYIHTYIHTHTHTHTHSFTHHGMPNKVLPHPIACHFEGGPSVPVACRGVRTEVEQQRCAVLAPPARRQHQGRKPVKRLLVHVHLQKKRTVKVSVSTHQQLDSTRLPNP